jgi:phosphoserine phosphatase RsbU/P
MRILIVDDSEDIREITEAMLMESGYSEIVTADSAETAFGMLAIGNPQARPMIEVDLVLLDIVMPNIDGIKACALIRSDPRYFDLPIIMVTSLDDMDSLSNAFIAGASDYINKPIRQVELLARVRSAIKLKAELDRRQSRERVLLEFMSTWGDRRANNWIDKVSGLFVGEVAEAYLVSSSDRGPEDESSVIAVGVDRLEAYRSTQASLLLQQLLPKLPVRSAQRRQRSA